MSRATNAQIIHVIRATIQQLEQDPETRPDDPALDVLKRLLIRRIAHMDAVGASDPAESIPLSAPISSE